MKQTKFAAWLKHAPPLRRTSTSSHEHRHHPVVPHLHRSSQCCLAVASARVVHRRARIQQQLRNVRSAGLRRGVQRARTVDAPRGAGVGLVLQQQPHRAGVACEESAAWINCEGASSSDSWC